MSETLDIAVVGAGPCGLAVGAAAKKKGLSARIFDRGCITESLVSYPVYMTFFSTAEKLEIEGVPFIVRDGKPTRQDALVYYRRVAGHFQLDVRQYVEVTAVEGAEGDFTVRLRDRDGAESECHARAVVIATGGFGDPNYLGVPGEDLPKVKHYFVEPLPYYDQDVVVVGGGNSAVEGALELFRAEARVTFVHFADELDRGVKPWVIPDIRNRFEKKEIPVRWRTRVAEVRERSIVLRHDDTGVTEEIPNDWVFAMTGWQAHHGLLDAIGVEIDRETGKPHHDTETMETNVAGVYIAGVLAAGNNANKIFIENGRMHGGQIVAALTG